MRFGYVAIAVTSLMVAASPAVAQSTGLEELVGARAGQAEGEVIRRGYRNVGGQQGDDRRYSYWWSATRRQCVTIATMDGRYASITASPAPDCRQPAEMRPRPDDAYPNRPQPGYAPDPGYGRPPYRPGGNRPDYPSAPVVGGQAVDLGLVCFGDGSKNGIASGTTWTWNADRDRYEYGRYTQSTTEVFDASLMIQLWDGGGRVRLPKSLIPPINSRGDDGWWDLYDVQNGGDVITATYRLNGLNKPRVTIDRRSGRITVQGFGSYGFRGTCDLIGHTQRRF